MSRTFTARVRRSAAGFAVLLGVLGLTATALSATSAATPTATPTAARADSICPTFTPNSYQGDTGLSTSVSDPKPGDVIHILGKGFPPNSLVPLYVDDPVFIGDAHTDAAGSFDFLWTVPADAKPGERFTFTAKCGTLTVTTVIHVSSRTVATTSTTPAATPVTPAPTTPAAASPAALPKTGSSSTLPLLAAGTALVVVGGLVVLVMRKRTQRSTT